MSLAQLRAAPLGAWIRFREHHSRALATVLTTAVIAYVAWKIFQSPGQALQFAFNGLPVGAVYALLAMGFTLVYSTVWFFDLYYGAAAALGAYGVFYLRSQDFLGGRYDVNNHFVNIAFALVVAGVVAWALHVNFHSRLRTRLSPTALRAVGGAPSLAIGVYMWLVLANPNQLNAMLSPVIGALVAAVAFWLLHRGYGRLADNTRRLSVLALAPPAAALGAFCGFLVASTPESNLYLSWGVSCVLAGAVSLALYRGLYVYMRLRAKSPLIMLVASLGILLAITAITTIIFRAAPRPLPEAFGSDVWTVAGANIKGFNVFAIGVALAGFAGLLLLLKKTAFGTAVRAIGDDEEVSKVVGINTTVVIAVVFFIGAMFAALAGTPSGHDTAIQPRMGLPPPLNVWIPSVIGGLGNLPGAIIGGFALGMTELLGICDLPRQW